MQVREFDLRSIDKMLPCPFCGGEAELDTHRGYRSISGALGNQVAVYCTKCGADQSTCIEDVPDIHPNEVIEQWNKRVATPPRELLADALEALSEAAAIFDAIKRHGGTISQQVHTFASGPRTEAKEAWAFPKWMLDELDSAETDARAAADKIRAALGGEGD